MFPELLKNWLIGNMGTPGDYMYQPIHLVSTAVVMAVFVLICGIAIAFRRDSRKIRRLLVAVAVFQLVFEIGWRLIYLLVKGDSILCWWHMYPCNLGGVLIPVIALMNLKKIRPKQIICIVLCLALSASAALFGINTWVKQSTASRILQPEEAAAITDVDCILVLGCLVRDNGVPSHMLEDRLTRGVAMYQADAAPKLLI